MQIKKLGFFNIELQDGRKIEACAKRYGVAGDPTRMKICYLLCHYPELSVSEIAELSESPVSTISHSLKKLKEIHAVVHRRCAKEVFYSLSQDQFAGLLKSQLLEA